MSRIDDGSDELNEAVKAVGYKTDAQLASVLEKWAENGVKISWLDFVEREHLKEVARRLRAGFCHGGNCERRDLGAEPCSDCPFADEWGNFK